MSRRRFLPKAAARVIRRAISDARTHGWRRPPRMVNLGRGLEYDVPLYGEAWERTMRRRGLYPPPAPRGGSGISR